MRKRRMDWAGRAAGWALACLPWAAHAVEPCRIEVVDGENGWPVPLVELQSTHAARWVTDNQGLIAWDDPEMMGREIWVSVKGHGYGVPKDGFGYEGVRLHPVPGGSLRITVERRQLAKRLGRLTGAGLAAEAEKLGLAAPLPESGIFGCDSVLLARYREKLFWLWGDTTLPDYPLGVFDSTAATTSLQPLASFQPPVVMRYDWFRDDRGKPRGVASLPGKGPTWLSGLTSVPDPDGEERLVAAYAKIRSFVTEYEIGLCVWQNDRQQFEPLRRLWQEGEEKPALLPRGHPVRWQEDGREWLLFGDPFPQMRCAAEFSSWADPETWRAVPLPADPVSGQGETVTPHRGSIAWNAHRRRWVAVFTQHQGKPSPLGEIWYAEASSPFGPWGTAVKILTHDNYTFYNPRIHPELVPETASFLVFEGTYTAMFAHHAAPTPRYDYNQVLYRLDLDDPALAEARGD